MVSKAVETKNVPEKSIEELNKQLLEFKDQGNHQIKQKKYPEAASNFTDGINFFLANEA